ncbi:unnamed protein product [Lactuca saligna]|uniref:ATP-dependent DNA helicase n=1 Tax=Lactuca saligna TaxID=75948 RepID=A0AA35UVM0_LACSI|nr:unnamed protein product [Lactuca saligna]
MSLHLHLPNQQLVRFSDNDSMIDIVDREKDKSSMLTAFFNMNKMDEIVRQYLYKEFPRYFTWSSTKRCWKQRKKGAMRGRSVSANPTEGERYYLQTDDNLSQCLTEASLYQFLGAVRRLFATVLIYCEPGDVRKLWDDHYNSLSEDYMRQCESVERVQTMVLMDISIILQSMAEYSIVVDDEHLRAKDSLNTDQKNAYDEIMTHVNQNRPGVFFIDGPGGTGKTFLYKALLAEVRSHGHIALATASSGAAANNMPMGRTSHLAKITQCAKSISKASSRGGGSNDARHYKGEPPFWWKHNDLGRFCGEERIYYSFDEAEDDKNNVYPMEFLNSIDVSGLPPHYLRLKTGCPIILIRLCPSDDDMFPFKLKRKQFPIQLSFAMTINKAQGQTIPNVDVYLPESVFSHGQLYVALSRGISRENTKVLVKPISGERNLHIKYGVSRSFA